MALTNGPFGLRPTRSLGHMDVSVNEYYHASGDSTALFIGDPVQSSTQDSSTSAVSGMPDGTPIVTASGTQTTGFLRGACTGVKPTLTNLTLQYAAASTGLGVLVADSPWQLFAIQSNGTTQVADVGNQMGITSGTGSTTTGISAYVATESTGHSTNAYCLRVVRLLPLTAASSSMIGANGILEVIIALHELNNQADE